VNIARAWIGEKGAVDRKKGQAAGLGAALAGTDSVSKEDEEAEREILNHQPDGEYTWSTEEPCAIYRWVGKDKRPTGE